MMRTTLFGMTVALAFGSLLYCAETISVSAGRPLATLAAELRQRCHCAVTYEEGPYDKASLRPEARANGAHFVGPTFVPMKFSLPANGDPNTATDAGRDDATGRPTPQTMQLLLEQYGSSGNPGRFTVSFEGQYIHILPVGQSALSTAVSMPTGSRPCKTVLDDIAAQVGSAYSTRVRYATLPVGPLLNHSCESIGDNLTARQALAQVLLTIGAGGKNGEIRTTYIWALMHDANTGDYFLDVDFVPSVAVSDRGQTPEEETTTPRRLPAQTKESQKATTRTGDQKKIQQ